MKKKKVKKKNKVVSNNKKIAGEKEFKTNEVKKTLETEFVKNNKINLSLITFGLLLYLEVAYKLIIFSGKNLFSVNTLVLVTFLGFISFIIGTLSKASKSSKKNKIIYFVIMFLIVCWFCISLVFKKVFNTFFCLSILTLSDQALAFSGTVIRETCKNIGSILVLLLPYLFVLKMNTNFDFKKLNKSTLKINLSGFVGSLCLFLAIMGVTKNSNMSSYYLFYKINNNALNVEQLGVLPSFYLDVKRLLWGFDEVIDNPSDDNLYEVEDGVSGSEDTDVDYGYNTVDINFDDLLTNEKNKTLVTMHNYFKSLEGTKRNEYTGYFKDKNLIVIMAESLSTIAINEELTPTLYKLSNNGFVFNNFYTPVNLSTIGGEFQDLTGLFANLNDLNSYWRKGTNYFPYGFGTMYKNAGYSVKSYHSNSAYFQDRNVYLKNLGFDYFKARYTGLEKLMDCSKWPPSDYDMVKATIDEYINEDKFMTYYVSVSGHMPYSRSGNNIVAKNWDLVKNLDLSNEAKGYLAANIELDKALAFLIESLEASGKLDDTVIAVVPDHYPYSMNINSINELSTYERDEVVEVNHNTLIIWNNQMDNIQIDKVASQLDFMPTLYNLFGLEYDSRLFMGKDILSDTLGVAYFANRSWVTNEGTYFASTNKFAAKDNKEVSEEYIKNINNLVANRINMSKLIIEKNYYNVVFNSKK